MGTIRGALPRATGRWAAVGGFAVTFALGKKLVGLEVQNQRVEAELRRSLVFLETQPTSVCVGVFTTNDIDASVDSASQTTTHLLPATPHFLPQFRSIYKNYLSLFANFGFVNLWLSFYEQVAILMPYFLMSPLLFESDPASRILLGRVVQVSSAFGHVFASLNIVADSWPQLNEFFSTVVRLRQYERNVFQGLPHPSRVDGTRRSSRAVFGGGPTEVALTEIAPDTDIRGFV